MSVPLITMLSNCIYVIDILVCVKEYIKEDNKGKNNTVKTNLNKKSLCLQYCPNDTIIYKQLT